MSRVRVKVCGITSPAALQAAIDAGVDAVGFVMSPSPRQLDARRVEALMRLVPPWVSSVIVTRHPGEDFLQQVIAPLAPNAWQSDRADLEGVPLPAGVRAIPVLREGEHHTSFPPTFVYEGSASGSGQPIDWPAAAQLARHGQMILAGGLEPANVAAAIETVRPWGVDVSSGVEAAPGKKDAARINAFMAAVSAASATL